MTNTTYALILGMLSLALGCNNLEIISEGLNQQDANLVMVTLREHNIDAHKEGIKERKGTTYQVAVQKKNAKEALKILVYEQLPKTHRPGLREVFTPASSGLIPTKSDEQARLVMAQEGELEALLKLLPGVIDARVALSLDQNPDSFKGSSAKSAAVALTYKPGSNEDELPVNAQEVAGLVSFAVGSIAIEQVMVVLKPLKMGLTIQTTPPPEKRLSPFILWGLLALTFLALLLAAYSFIRWNLSVNRRSEAT